MNLMMFVFVGNYFETANSEYKNDSCGELNTLENIEFGDDTNITIYRCRY